jgi:heme/copper-type cytochrome/quinol oxidase subunit 1
MAGFVVLFVIGGVSGVVTAVVPFDWQVTDTYFVVAHLHYVLIGINVFPVIGGIYYWFPKMTGRMMDERLGKTSFWLMFVGAIAGFFPMHIVGLLGMPRRIYTYPPHLGWDGWNLVETIGVYIFALGVVAFIVNVIWSLRRGEAAGPNPWDAPTLEWSTSSPPPPYNFAVIPTVRSRHPLWEDRLREEGEASSIDRGLALDRDGRRTVATTPLDSEPFGVFQMPSDSIWPLSVAVSLLILFFGLLGHRTWGLAIAGAVLLLFSAIGWMWPTTTTPNPKEL